MIRPSLNMVMIFFVVLSVSLLGSHNQSQAWLSWPSSYDACIQKYAAKPKTKKALQIIRRACSDLFSKNKKLQSRSKCTLKLKPLYEAETNQAAGIIHKTSKCVGG